MTAPLLITEDPDLGDDVLRLAAAAGVAPRVVGVDGALAGWAAASLVLVGSDVAAALAALRVARREGVLVLCRGTADRSLLDLALAVGAESVVDVVEAQGWLVEVLTDAGDLRPASGLTVGVLGGAGGAGASTFACALAQVAARGSAALLVDADPYGPGLDRMLGMDELDGVRWDALAQSTGRLSARSLAEAVPRRDGLGVVSWRPGTPSTLSGVVLREVMSAGRRGHDRVVVDLPRGGDPVVDDALARCDLVVLLVPATLPGLASSARVAHRLPAGARIEIVARGTGIAPGDIAAVVGSPVLTVLTDQRGVSEAFDLGMGPVRSRRGPLVRAAVDVLDALLPASAA